MKLHEMFPIALVVVGAAAALALGNAAIDSDAVFQRQPVVSQARWFPVGDALSPSQAVVASDEVALEPAPEILPLRAQEAVTFRNDKLMPVSEKKAVVAAPRRAVAARKAELPRSRILVEGRGVRGDRRLQTAAMTAIARTPNLSGKIGVEARNSVIRLSGWTTTVGQSWRAERAAARVAGVRMVVNEIRPRLGAVTS